MSLPTPEEALLLVLAHARPHEAERCRMADARGLALAEDIGATEDFPAFTRAMMDGYAVRSRDAGRGLRLTGLRRAGGESVEADETGCMAIMTGAPVPACYDAVVPIEETRREGDEVRLPEVIRPGQHLAPVGSECAAGSLVLAKGSELTPPRLAVLASLGATHPLVTRPARVLIVTTGDEVETEDKPLLPGRIRDANGPMLVQLACETAPCLVKKLHAPDAADSLSSLLAAHTEEDLLVFSGGVSMGTHDLVPGALAASGARILFHKVAQKPGKPLLFAARGSQLIFGLPGTPLGSALCFHRYVAPALRARMGLSHSRPTFSGLLEKEVVVRGDRFLFVPARVAYEHGEWRVMPLQGRGSSDVFGVESANAWMAAGYGPRRAAAGTRVEFQLSRWL